MKVLVAVKRVVDAYVKIRVASDGSGVETANTKMSMNPFDEIALEAAIRMVESGQASEVIAVSIGPEAVQEQLRTALAMGAQRAIHVDGPSDLEPLAVAKTLKALCDREAPDLVILGKQAIDDDSNQTGQMLGALQDWGQATSVSALEFDDDKAIATREIDGGLERLAVQLPGIISVDLRLNDPRHPKLPDIMKAKRAPIEALTLDDLSVSTERRLDVLEVREPPARTPGVKVNSVSELIAKLRDEAGVMP